MFKFVFRFVQWFLDLFMLLVVCFYMAASLFWFIVYALVPWRRIHEHAIDLLDLGSHIAETVKKNWTKKEKENEEAK